MGSTNGRKLRWPRSGSLSDFAAKRLIYKEFLFFVKIRNAYNSISYVLQKAQVRQVLRKR